MSSGGRVSRIAGAISADTLVARTKVQDLTLADAILRNDTNGNYTVWMDEDGRHVWQHHVCVGLPEESMLPRGTYKFWTEQEGRVVPSINCTRCGLHEVNVPVYKGN